jgi:hypothetical protein
VLDVRSKNLRRRASQTAPVKRTIARRRRALRPVPPSWRTCRVTMSRVHFFGIVGGWIGAIAIVLALVLMLAR